MRTWAIRVTLGSITLSVIFDALCSRLSSSTYLTKSGDHALKRHLLGWLPLGWCHWGDCRWGDAVGVIAVGVIAVGAIPLGWLPLGQCRWGDCRWSDVIGVTAVGAMPLGWLPLGWLPLKWLPIRRQCCARCQLDDSCLLLLNVVNVLLRLFACLFIFFVSFFFCSIKADERNVAECCVSLLVEQTVQ